jgi:hypothetical protein
MNFVKKSKQPFLRRSSNLGIRDRLFSKVQKNDRYFELRGREASKT